MNLFHDVNKFEIITMFILLGYDIKMQREHNLKQTMYHVSHIFPISCGVLGPPQCAPRVKLNRREGVWASLITLQLVMPELEISGAGQVGAPVPKE